MESKARLHPHWVGGRDGYRYSVLYDGKLLVERSRDPECDAARALVAKGITGKLAMLDGKTGVPRTVVDIENAAKLTVSEESRDGLRFRTYRGNPDNSAHSPETGAAGPSEPPNQRRGCLEAKKEDECLKSSIGKITRA